MSAWHPSPAPIGPLPNLPGDEAPTGRPGSDGSVIAKPPRLSYATNSPSLLSHADGSDEPWRMNGDSSSSELTSETTPVAALFSKATWGWTSSHVNSESADESDAVDNVLANDRQASLKSSAPTSLSSPKLGSTKHSESTSRRTSTSPCEPKSTKTLGDLGGADSSSESWTPVHIPSMNNLRSKSIHSHLPILPSNASGEWEGPTSYPYPPSALSPLQASLAWSLSRLLSRPIFQEFISSPAGYAQFHSYLSKDGRPDTALAALELWRDLETLRSAMSRGALAAKAMRSVYMGPDADKQVPLPSTLARDANGGLKAVAAAGAGLDEPSRHLLNSLFANEFQGFVKHRLLQHTRVQLARYEVAEGVRNGLGDAFCLTNPRLRDAPIVLASPAFCALTGYSAQQIIGRNCRFLQGEATSPESVKAIRKAIDEEEPITQLLLNYTAHGVPFWNLLCILPLRNAQGELTYFIGGQTNLTGAIAAGSGEDLSFVLSAQDAEDGPVIKPGSYTGAVENRIESRRFSLVTDKGPSVPSSPKPPSVPSEDIYGPLGPPKLPLSPSTKRLPAPSVTSVPASTTSSKKFLSFLRGKKSSSSGLGAQSDAESIRRKVPRSPSHLAPPSPSLATMPTTSPRLAQLTKLTSHDQMLLGAESLIDQAPAPIEKKILDFQMTYERVVLIRAENREILFVTSGFLRFLGLPGASLAEVYSSPLIHSDLFTLIRGDDQKPVRLAIKHGIEQGESMSLRCGMSHVKGLKGVTVGGTLHLSPLKDLKGDPIAYVGVFG